MVPRPPIVAPADVAVVLDSGALIAVDRRDRRVGAMLRAAQRERVPVRTSAAVVAQVWRSGARQVNLARTLAGVAVFSLDGGSGRRVGKLLAASRSRDVVNAHVALITEPDDTMLTSDPDDLRALLAARAVSANLLAV